jgi:hypothetical protein
MGTQLNIFQEMKLSRYEEFKKHFYRGVRERQEKAMNEFNSSKFKRISIIPKSQRNDISRSH